MSNKTPETSGPAFETALARLEEIVSEMENAELPLDDILARYEEGSKLRVVCENKLKEAEKRIQQIKPGKDGAPNITEFEPGALEEETPARAKKARKSSEDFLL